MGYKGPSMQFKTVAGFERAVDVCRSIYAVTSGGRTR